MVPTEAPAEVAIDVIHTIDVELVERLIAAVDHDWVNIVLRQLLNTCLSGGEDQE